MVSKPRRAWAAVVVGALLASTWQSVAFSANAGSRRSSHNVRFDPPPHRFSWQQSQPWSKRRSMCVRATLARKQKPPKQDSCVVPDTATLPALMVSLVKNIVGAGILALPAGVAAVSDAPAALVPASLAAVAMGCASGYSFALVARACELTGGATYREAWARAIGQGTAWVVSVTSMVKTGIGCLMFSMILADAGSALGAACGVPAMLCSRSGALLAITGLVVLPLCFLESLSVLQYTSFAGVVGTLYTIACMCFRWVEGSYLLGGRFHHSIPADMAPSIAVHGGTFLSTKAYLLVSLLATAFVAHYNAPKYYRELENRSLPRFYQLVAGGFGGAALLYILAMAFGFLTFGGHATGMILNNYATGDALISVARAAISFSCLCTYPLLFSPLREGMLEMLGASKVQSAYDEQCATATALSQRVTIFLMAAITSIALAVHDLGRVAALGGGIFGSLLIFVFPPMIFLAATGKNALEPPSTAAARRARAERVVCRCLQMFGSALVVTSAGSNLVWSR